MKTTILNALLLAAIAIGSASFAIGETRLIIVAPHGLQPNEETNVVSKIGYYLLHEAEPGLLVSVFDPITQSIPVEFTVPEGSPRARAAHKDLRTKVPKLKEAFAQAADEDWQKNAARLPETLRFIRNKIAATSDKVTVLAIGNPVYKSGETVYDFANGAVPGYGWLRTDIEDLHFSIAKQDTFKGWRVFLASVPSNWRENNDWFARKVEHFFAAFVQLQGGRFMLADLTVVLKNLGKGDVPETNIPDYKPEDRDLIFYKHTTQRGVVMCKANNVDVDTERSSARSAVQTNEIGSKLVFPAQTPAPIAETLRSLPHVGVGEIGIGAAWQNAAQQTDCDIDVHIMLKGVTGELAYSALQLKEGSSIIASLNQDVRIAQGLATEATAHSAYEFATIHRKCLPEEVTLFLNVFQNRSSSPISIALLVEYDNKRWIKLIQIPATAGDHGASRDRSNSKDWVRIDLPELIAKPSISVTK